MRYFTPERYVALQDFSSNATMNAADAVWEKAVDEYDGYLNSVQHELPPGLRHMQDSYYLHDATAYVMGRRDHSFVIVLQLDTPPKSILTFTYDLVAEPVIDRAALPPEHCTHGTQVEWQYDEVERIAGEPPTWQQSILLSNGWEVKLHFRDVAVVEAEALLPAPHAQSNGAVPMPKAQSA